MKKLMMVLFMTMGVVCFADYKSDFSWDMTDSAKIEKGLAEATQAKDLVYMDVYSIMKAFAGKDAKNITYDEYKKICKSIKINRVNYPVVAIGATYVKRLNTFMVNVANDNTLSKYELSYVNKFYSIYPRNMFNAIEWRKRFVNVETLNDLSKKFNDANTFFNVYKTFSTKFTNDEIKADTALMKRAWYDKIIDSDAWKQLLVKIELVNKSVQ